ncbi:hypothetical protein LTR37_001740 [Vermiconidia calcicola]|uniref:Uncharacterized protein n=1 Tax=Vermiconidia calcicola TaxID=1690605 RepID=A0ACC3NV41_9PEZI|nr:hypothetical protein LTR37_001740 [Vermiconidia calcicola]
MSNGKNTVGVVAVVHHSDCGLRNFSNKRVAEMLKVRADLDDERAKEVDGMEFGSWSEATSIGESVKGDMDIIKNDPYLPKGLQVVGYTYDVFTGKTTEV